MPVVTLLEILTDSSNQLLDREISILLSEPGCEKQLQFQVKVWIPHQQVVLGLWAAGPNETIALVVLKIAPPLDRACCRRKEALNWSADVYFHIKGDSTRPTLFSAPRWPGQLQFLIVVHGVSCDTRVTNRVACLAIRGSHDKPSTVFRVRIRGIVLQYLCVWRFASCKRTSNLLVF